MIERHPSYQIIDPIDSDVDPVKEQLNERLDILIKYVVSNQNSLYGLSIPDCHKLITTLEHLKDEINYWL